MITQFFYNSYGKIKKTINPKGQESQYIYGQFGQLIKRITPDNGTTDYRYDISNLLIAEQDAKGANEKYIRHYDYDIFGKMTKQQRVYGQSSTTTPFGVGNISYSLENGLTLSSNIDSLGARMEKEWFYHDNANVNTTEIFPQIAQVMNNTLSSYHGKLTFAKSYDNQGIPVIYLSLIHI